MKNLANSLTQKKHVRSYSPPAGYRDSCGGGRLATLLYLCGSLYSPSRSVVFRVGALTTPHTQAPITAPFCRLSIKK